MLKALGGNYSPGLVKASPKAKSHFLEQSVAAIGSFRWYRWPWSQAVASRCGSLQRMCFAKLYGVGPKPQEDLDAYRQRRKVLCTHLARDAGLFSDMWNRNLLSWEGHFARTHDSGSWASKAFEYRGKGWIASRRAQASSGSESRTRTRLNPGRPALRWDESFELI